MRPILNRFLQAIRCVKCCALQIKPPDPVFSTRGESFLYGFLVVACGLFF